MNHHHPTNISVAVFVVLVSLNACNSWIIPNVVHGRFRLVLKQHKEETKRTSTKAMMMMMMDPNLFHLTTQATPPSSFPTNRILLATNENDSPQPPQTPSLSSISDSELAKELGLKSPTEDKPQILFNGNERNAPLVRNPTKTKAKNEREPILRGMVYLLHPEDERPSATDTLVLSAERFSSPNVILLGAKIPVSQISFPFLFQMYKENILSRNAEEFMEDDDLIVNARICPESSKSLPCSDVESTFRAKGIAKAIRNLPGMEEGQMVRSAAALSLDK